MGKIDPGNPRPLCVELRNEEKRDELLGKSRILREDSEQLVRMKPDLTNMQQDQDIFNGESVVLQTASQNQGRRRAQAQED